MKHVHLTKVTDLRRGDRSVRLRDNLSSHEHRSAHANQKKKSIIFPGTVKFGSANKIQVSNAHAADLSDDNCDFSKY